MHRSRLLLVAVAVGLAWGCGEGLVQPFDGGITPGTGTTARIDLIPNDSVTMTVGEARQLSATAIDTAGATLPDRIVTWSTTSAVVTLSNATGTNITVTAVAAGRAGVRATADGRTDSLAINVTGAAVPRPRP